MDEKRLLLETEKLPEWVNHIEGIDVKAGVEHCDSAEDYMEALEVYIGSVHEKAEMLEKLVKEEDLKTFTMRIHSLKSMSRLVGAEGLADRSKELEDAGEQEDLPTVKKELPGLLAEYRKLERLVVHFYKDIPEEPEGAESIPLDVLDDAYQAIDEFAQHYDKESIRMVLASLKEYHLPEMDKARTEVIEKALEDNDWAGIRYELGLQ
ncbi:MAG: Hpt domain-containing protein [Eubacterium sp.]|nr:Hpt domain-containing protein [Eubacterium sp.]